jgi:hypothetical protein
MSKPFHLAIEAIPRNAGFVSDNSAPRPSQMVEKRRFSDVRASDNGDQWKNFVFLAQEFLIKVCIGCVVTGLCPVPPLDWQLATED